MLTRLKALRTYVASLDVAVLIAVGTLLVASYVFLQTVDEVVEGESEHIDRAIVEWIARIDTPKWIEEAVRDVTAFGGIFVLVLVTMAVGAYLLIRRERHALIFLLTAVIGAAILSNTLKLFFDRDRPTILEHRSHTLTSSFPSGHAMLSAAVWLTLAVLLARLHKSPWLKAYFICIGLMISFLVGVSRVWLGVHWPTDVLAGWTAGTIWAIACWFLLRYLQRRGAVERAKDAPPPV